MFLSLARVSIARKRTRRTERSHAYVDGRREQDGVSPLLRGGIESGNLAVADEVTDPDFLDHEAHPGGDRGPESMRQVITMLRTAFPDLHFAIEHLVAEGDTVAGRLTMSGTHKGPLMGMPPTGRSVRQNSMHFVRFRDGKGIEHWGCETTWA